MEEVKNYIKKHQESLISLAFLFILAFLVGIIIGSI